MKLYTYTTLFLLFIIFNTQLSAETYKMGFGSCIDQRLSQDIWLPIENENINSFIFLGDNVYGDQPSGELNTVIDAYKKQESIFPKWLGEVTLYPTWDDHDYGSNDGGGSYKYKKESQEIYLDFWNIPANDPRHFQNGIYFDQLITVDDLTIHLIVLDTRYFRSDLVKFKGPYPSFKKNVDKDATILGGEQWSWLKKVVTKKSDAIILVSSIQVLATSHGYEKWELFPNERTKLMNIINNSSKPVLIVSGDRHIGALYEKDGIFEITSSSLNKPISPIKLKLQKEETDPLMIGKVFKKENYGVLEVNAQEKSILFGLKDMNGRKINEEKIILK